MRSQLLLACVAAVSATYTPAFIWAENDGLLGKNTEHLKEVSSVAIERTVAALANLPSEVPQLESLIQKPVKQAPGVQLVLIAPGLKTDAVRKNGALFPNLQRLMTHSASSLSVPFTSPATAEFPSMFHNAPRVAAHKVHDFLATHPFKIAADKVADLLVVALPEGTLAEQDTAIGEVTAAISKVTNGDYAGLLIGSDAHSPNKNRRMLSDAPDVPKLRITRDLLTALLVSFVLFVIFISGFCCLFKLQTPRKFDDVRKHTEHGHGHAH